jgi:hypothetical protein
MILGALSRQLLQQRLSLFQIERVEAFGKPAVHRSKQIAILIPLALIAPEPRHARRRAEEGVCAWLVLHTPIASDKHFLVKLVFAAPCSF